MKEWFKYEFGYVNIDSENLYLTNTGNWSETKDLEEKTQKAENKSNNRSSLMIGYILIVFLIFAILLSKNFISEKISLTLIILTVFGGYQLYKYLKTEIGANFLIPLNKISEINAKENSVEIIFTNGEGNIDNYKLYKIEEKGILILNKLK